MGCVGIGAGGSVADSGVGECLGPGLWLSRVGYGAALCRVFAECDDDEINTLYVPYCTTFTAIRYQTPRDFDARPFFSTPSYHHESRDGSEKFRSPPTQNS